MASPIYRVPDYTPCGKIRVTLMWAFTGKENKFCIFFLNDNEIGSLFSIFWYVMLANINHTHIHVFYYSYCRRSLRVLQNEREELPTQASMTALTGSDFLLIVSRRRFGLLTWHQVQCNHYVAQHKIYNNTYNSPHYYKTALNRLLWRIKQI